MAKLVEPHPNVFFLGFKNQFFCTFKDLQEIKNTMETFATFLVWQIVERVRLQYLNDRNSNFFL